MFIYGVRTELCQFYDGVVDEMPVPKKPNKRRSKKTKHVMTPEEKTRFIQSLRLRRQEQANAIRKQIQDNAGDILHELPLFTGTLDDWVQYGKMKQGTEYIASADRDIEWRFHDTISRVPEVWIRSPHNDTKT